MNTGGERIMHVGDELSRIANVAELVEAGRVPICVSTGQTGEILAHEKDNTVFYNVPPVGFTLGKNGCTGNVDPVDCSVEYFDGNGNSLGHGTLVGIRVGEAQEMDKEIDAAREKFGY